MPNKIHIVRELHSDEIEYVKEVSPKYSTRFYPLHKYGCYVGIIEAALFGCAILLNNLPDCDSGNLNIYQITDPESPEMIYAANELLGSSFEFSDFAGRSNLNTYSKEA